MNAPLHDDSPEITPRSLARGALAGLLLLFILPTGGCTPEQGQVGATCTSHATCAQAFCLAGRCESPTGDLDQDGLTNAQERALGTDPTFFDSDHDQLSDGLEVGSVDQPSDSDGDGKIDALESALDDADLDCVRDQYDPDDATQEVRLDVIRAANCKQVGVCGDQIQEVQVRCDLQEIAGETVAQATCDYGAVVGYQADPEWGCDGIDNDCDGAIDEALAYIQDDGAVRSVGESCLGLGLCQELEGIVECGREAQLTCSVNAAGSNAQGNDEVLCDGLDNDCNGVVDDGVHWVDPATGVRRAIGEVCEGRGLCGLGVVECDGSKSQGICSSEPQGSTPESVAEICDGFDNDCDGQVDEGMVVITSQGVRLDLGVACGIGACDGGIVVCQAGSAACSTAPLASSDGELCNDIDDDCDGLTDEEEDLFVHCPTQGLCASAPLLSATCQGEAPLPVCTYESLPGLELYGETLCDGLDNDCDGDVDEGLMMFDATGLAYGLGASCPGTGACADLKPGVIACGKAGTLVCTTNQNGDVDEVCNGIDDDCDGLTDEAAGMAVPEASCLTAGVCAAFGAALPSCLKGVWECPYAASAIFEADELTCDGLDNDCDGWVDEGTAQDFTGVVSTASPGQPPERTRWVMATRAPGVAFMMGGWFVPGGGSDDASVVLLNDFWRFESATSAWIPLPSGPPGRAGHALAYDSHHDVLLVHGGLKEASFAPGDGGLQGASRSDLWLFDFATQTWHSVVQDASMLALPGPVKRHFHTLTQVGEGTLLLHGGRADAPLLPNQGTLKLSLKKVGGGEPWLGFWENTPAAWPSRSGHRALHDGVNDRLVVVGGVSASGATPSLVGFLDLNTWNEAFLGELSELRRDPAVGRVGDQVLIHGGHSLAGPGGAFPPTLAPGALLLDLSMNTLTPLDGEGVAPEAVGGSLIPTGAQAMTLVGGLGGSGWAARSQTVFNLETLKWGPSSTWAGPSPRTGALLVQPEDGGDLWLLGGRHRSSWSTEALHDVWRLEAGADTWQAFGVAGVSADLPDWVRGQSAALHQAIPARILGVSADDGALGMVLWSLDLATQTWSKLAVQGPGPPLLNGVFLIREPATQNLLLGGTTADAIHLFRLDLATLTWTQLTESGSAGADLTGLVAGISAGSLRITGVHKDGQVVFLSLNLSTWTWTLLGSINPSGGVKSLVTGGFDAANDQAILLLEHAEGQVKAWIAQFSLSALFPLESSGPLPHAPSDLVLNPVLGAIFVGGTGPKNQEGSTAIAFEQGCSQ